MDESIVEAPSEKSGDSLLSIEGAAEVIGVSAASISNWIRSGRFPTAQDQFGSTSIELSVAEAVRALRDEHGRAWHRHVPTDWLTKQSDETGLTLAQKIASRATELKAEGKHEMACELYGILSDHCDWSQV